MGLRDIFRGRRRNGEIVPYDIEPTHDDDGFTILGRGKGQRSGRVKGATRNSQASVSANHPNRAGRRHYVRVMQTRAFRKSVLGWGSWRLHNADRDGHHAAARDNLNPNPPRERRRWRRIDAIAEYRRQRRLRTRRVTIPGR